MRNVRTPWMTWIAGLVFGLALMAGRAQADPVGFAVNRDSQSVSVVDLTTRTTRATINTLLPIPSDPGSEPSDVVVDPQSGWVYVSSRSRLIAFNGRLAVGTPPIVDVAARDKGTGLAIDVTGRRLFMSHGDIPGADSGIITEFSIANPAQPVVTKEWIAVEIFGPAQAHDLRYIAWDARNSLLFAVSDAGVVFATFQEGLLSKVADGVINPAGILADPAGGVWISSRLPGNLVRIASNGAKSSFVVGFNHPRGLAWDTTVAGSILVAVDTQNIVRRFRPSTGLFDTKPAMLTAENPQDVGVTAAGAIVSLNRRVNATAGNVTVAGVSQPVDTTAQRSIALAVTDIARITAVPVAKDFCWNQLGDTKQKLFTIQNTRLDRASMTLLPVAIGGSNPTRYSLVGANTCNNAILKFGATCEFTVQFVANGGCVQPPPPFGNPNQICYWPSEVVVSSTAGAASTTIPVRGTVAVHPCPP